MNEVFYNAKEDIEMADTPSRNQISELEELVQKLREVSNLAAAQRDHLIRENHGEYEIFYNMVIRSIGEAAVTANAIASSTQTDIAS